MNDQELIAAAIQYLEELNDNFRKTKTESVDELRFQEYIDTTLKQVRQAKKVDNRLLIALEKFYQSSSMLIGLSTLKLDPVTYQSWRAYDKFHFANVKTQLHLYGPVLIM